MTLDDIPKLFCRNLAEFRGNAPGTMAITGGSVDGDGKVHLLARPVQYLGELKLPMAEFPPESEVTYVRDLR